MHRVASHYAHLFYDLHLTIKSRSSAFNQRHASRQTHPIHITPCVEIVQSIEHQIKATKPVDVKLTVLDVGMIRFQLRARLKLVCHFLRNLYSKRRLVRQGEFIRLLGGEVGGEGRGRRGWRATETHQCFGLLDVFETEEKLAIQIAQVDGIEIDDVNFAEPR